MTLNIGLQLLGNALYFLLDDKLSVDLFTNDRDSAAQYSHRALNINDFFCVCVNGFRILGFRIPDASRTIGEPPDYSSWEDGIE